MTDRRQRDASERRRHPLARPTEYEDVPPTRGTADAKALRILSERPLLSLQSLMRVVGIPPEELIDAWDGRESLPPPARIHLSRLLREFQQELAELESALSGGNHRP